MTYLNIRYSLIAKLQQSLGKKYVVVQSWIQVIPLGAGPSRSANVNNGFQITA